MSRRRLCGEMRTTRPSALAMPAQIWTVGPSRPSDAPEPICSVPRKNFPIASRSGTTPAARREGDLHLRDAAAARVRDDVLEQHAAHEAAGGRRRGSSSAIHDRPGAAMRAVDEMLLA